MLGLCIRGATQKDLLHATIETGPGGVVLKFRALGFVEFWMHIGPIVVGAYG